MQTANRKIDTANVHAMTGQVCFHAGVTKGKEAMPHVQTKTKFTSHPPRTKQTREELDVTTKMRKAVNVERKALWSLLSTVATTPDSLRRVNPNSRSLTECLRRINSLSARLFVGCCCQCGLAQRGCRCHGAIMNLLDRPVGCDPAVHV